MQYLRYCISNQLDQRDKKIVNVFIIRYLILISLEIKKSDNSTILSLCIRDVLITGKTGNIEIYLDQIKMMIRMMSKRVPPLM
jgi:hypothetical protein